ncbi:MAG: hypothetical protein A2144_09365 [Chloroflexi bacterium RBG_16_50_9]|nr:MAG: hypothetical protein A2144_09365 [Chloroflexi bacterium RBG_16_50_9]
MTTVNFSIMILQQIDVSISMEPKYSIGQKVRIKSVDAGAHASPRDSTLDIYSGQVGRVVNFYWISPRGSEIFYVYTVRVGTGNKEIALHEDEIEKHLG